MRERQPHNGSTEKEIDKHGRIRQRKANVDKLNNSPKITLSRVWSMHNTFSHVPRPNVDAEYKHNGDSKNIWEKIYECKKKE